MSDRFYSTITGIVKGQQLSISGISRELAKHGYSCHRLIITGYLRALEDLGYVKREDLPPSKVYTALHGRKDIYELISEKLEDVDREKRLRVAVYLLTKLLDRPCFKQELKMLAIPNPPSDHAVRTLSGDGLEEIRSDIKRIDIPRGDPAYEIVEGESPPEEAVEILVEMLRERLNLEGLKIAQKRLGDVR